MAVVVYRPLGFFLAPLYLTTLWRHTNDFLSLSLSFFGLTSADSNGLQLDVGSTESQGHN